MTANLLGWLSDPVEERGIGFASDGSGWEQWSYARLAGATHSVAEQLASAGVSEEQIVAIVIPTGPAFIAAYFGTLLAGATPAPLVPPTLFESDDAWLRRVVGPLGLSADVVATERSLLPLVQKAAALAHVPKGAIEVSPRERAADGSAPARRRAELALLQFTSGSTGQPRAVRVSFENLEGNIRMIQQRTRFQPDDSGAHWLPLYHDMGLIGGMLTPVAEQRPFRIMRPEQFVVDPLRWLDCFGREGMSFSVAPNFAFSYLAKKIAPEQLTGSDFSRWRGVIIGAERLDPGALSRFAAMLADHGFRPNVFLSAYGLAEATLAVTILGSRRPATAIRPDWTRLAFGSQVVVEEHAAVGDAKRIGSGAGWLLSCGEPVQGLDVSIHDERGARLPDGCLGEINVAGPTVAGGYVGSTGQATRFQAGKLVTGDAGFFYDGELYVVGRLGDAVKVRGKTLYAEDLEAKLAALPGMPTGRCVVLAGATDTSELVAIVERPDDGPWVEEAAKLLRRESGGVADVKIVCVARGTILRTSSGKPRRRTMWEALHADDLSVERVREWKAPAALETGHGDETGHGEAR